MAHPPPEARSLHLASRLDELPRLMAAVAGLAEQAAAVAADQSAFELALEEIVANIITHGFGGACDREIAVDLDRPAPGVLRAVVMDNAPAYDPLAHPAVDINRPLEERPIGGLGVHLVRSLMQVCLHERRAEGNRFTIERHSGASGLTLVASRDGDRVALTTTGRLDGVTSPDIARRIQEWGNAGMRHLVWDLSALKYVSSAGLRVFLMAAKSLRAAGGTLRFTAPQPEVREVLGIAGLLTALDVEPAAGAPRA